jgi:hypothetical protein
MTLRTAALLNFAITKAIKHDSGYFWKCSENKRFKSQYKCLETIARALKSSYSPDFSTGINFAVRDNLDTSKENQSVNLALIIESNQDSPSDEFWASLIKEVKEKLAHLFNEANRMSTLTTDDPIRIEVENKEQIPLSLQYENLGSNVRFVHSNIEKKILEEIVKIAQTQAEISYKIGVERVILESIPCEAINFVESDDIEEYIYVTMVCRASYTANVSLACAKNSIISIKQKVNFEPTQKEMMYKILVNECTARVRFSTVMKSQTNGTSRTYLDAVQEILSIDLKGMTSKNEADLLGHFKTSN